MQSAPPCPGNNRRRLKMGERKLADKASMLKMGNTRHRRLIGPEAVTAVFPRLDVSGVRRQKIAVQHTSIESSPSASAFTAKAEPVLA